MLAIKLVLSSMSYSMQVINDNQTYKYLVKTPLEASHHHPHLAENYYCLLIFTVSHFDVTGVRRKLMLRPTKYLK